MKVSIGSKRVRAFKMFDVLEKKTRPRGRDDSHVAEVLDLIVGSLFHS